MNAEGHAHRHRDHEVPDPRESEAFRALAGRWRPVAAGQDRHPRGRLAEQLDGLVLWLSRRRD